jgi:hypothetical protein
VEKENDEIYEKISKIYQQEGLLIEEQNISDLNPLFTIAQVRKQRHRNKADRFTHDNTQLQAQTPSSLHTSKKQQKAQAQKVH